MNVISPAFRHLLTPLAVASILAIGCGSSGSEDSDGDSRSCITIESSDELIGGASLDDDCYEIATLLTVDDGAIAIHADTTLYFNEGAGLSIEGSARLDVSAGAETPAVLRGDESQRGRWRGIYLGSPGPHHIEGLHLHDAGGDNWAGQPHLARGGIVIGSDDATVEVVDSHFENNEYAAITSATAEASIELSQNHFHNNDYPLRLHGNHLGGIDSDNGFADNRTNVILVHTDEAVTSQASWSALEIPYQIEEALPIRRLVTIEPQTTLSFEQHAGLDVDGGSLHIDAAGDEPVRFVGVSDTPGYWRGLRFRNTPPAGNVLTNIEVHHAGSERWNQSWGNSQAAILVDEEGFLDLNDALIAHSDYHGISVREALLVGCDDIRFESNHRHNQHSYDDDETCF